jgi:hypothetical protein
VQVEPLGLAGDQPPDLRLGQADAVLGQLGAKSVVLNMPRSAITTRNRHS